MSNSIRICLLGFGEVGQVLAEDLLADGNSQIVAWDIQFEDSTSLPSRRLQCIGGRRVRKGADPEDAVTEAQIVISAVTAAQDRSAAESVASSLAPGTWFLDLNSVSPDTKRTVARIVESCGARYVEAAVMAPIAPRRIRSPITIGGPHAEEFRPLVRSLGFTGVSVVSDSIGTAAATKMCRSVLVKGLEALFTESLLTARHYGVEESVLESLDNLFPGVDWIGQSQYMITRSVEHGRRRAEEMREVSRAVREAGIDPWMSDACALRQSWAADRQRPVDGSDLLTILDTLLKSAPTTSEGQGSS